MWAEATQKAAVERAATAKDEAAAQSAAAEQATAKVETPFAVGSRVQIHGLKAKPQKNGAIGTVQHFDPQSGRYRVRLEVGNTDATLKPINLIQKVALVDKKGGTKRPFEGDAAQALQDGAFKPVSSKAPRMGGYVSQIFSSADIFVGVSINLAE